MNSKLVCLFLFVCVFQLINGHGMLLDPVNRASRWRYDSSAPVNVDDNELSCGGFGTQWVTNGGKCGLCGDSYSSPTPRKNELGGPFGQGVIVKSYKSSTTIPVGVMIHTNHKGYFKFNICNLDKEKETEHCFEQYQMSVVGGDTKYTIPPSAKGWVNTTLTIPSGLTCKHCVLQWTYTTGNSWGTCEDGSGAMGCGAQETFRTCSDITIE